MLYFLPECLLLNVTMVRAQAEVQEHSEMPDSFSESPALPAQRALLRKQRREVAELSSESWLNSVAQHGRLLQALSP